MNPTITNPTSLGSEDKSVGIPTVKLTSRRATYLATLRERDLSLGKLCAYVPSTRPLGEALCLSFP
ncbi:hypothetical protein [Leptospira weilii]|uniref:hypothetical protein n=1 Tax=Leptospira weilii TaxID=28184 RepID=UPI000773BA03|nr:hypothetical protein [Leptospira weilii]